MSRKMLLALAAGCLVLGAAVELQAQPFGSWMSLSGTAPRNGYVEIPHDSALDPSSELTIEAWVAFDTGDLESGDCQSIAGKNWRQSWWIGQCRTLGRPTLRSYLQGTNFDAGVLSRGIWTHVAVTYDGSRRRHYINGELAAQVDQSGELPGSTDPMRIGSDVEWPFSPKGKIDEVRLWRVARTMEQIRANLNVRITTAQPGLVGVWALDGDGHDALGAHSGAAGGTGMTFESAATSPGCEPSTDVALCLNGRFRISTFWRTDPTPGAPLEGVGTVVNVANPGSGLFWFFSPDNWEVMVKEINGCSLNNRHWIFSAATTNVFYRMEVFDTHTGETKVYINYPGPPAPAVTDTSAFPCP